MQESFEAEQQGWQMVAEQRGSSLLVDAPCEVAELVQLHEVDFQKLQEAHIEIVAAVSGA